MITPFHVVGYASGIAGVDLRTALGPQTIQNSPYLKALAQKGFKVIWEPMLEPQNTEVSVEAVKNVCEALAEKVSQLVSEHKRFCVLGGDHTCAIGTWSGVFNAIHEKGQLGLIWIDAHMDSHTPDTSETGRMHGMPLATLLGKGSSQLTQILQPHAKLQPKNVCLIGIRSFERGEEALLKALNVRIYYMDEVKQRGFLTVLQEAIAHVNRNTIGYGVSLDLDGIDPLDAPAVDVPEPDGISAQAVFEGLQIIARDKRLLGTEIVEFDPAKDKNNKTEELVVSYLKCLAEST